MAAVYAYPQLTTYAWYGRSMPGDILIQDAFEFCLKDCSLAEKKYFFPKL